LYDPGVLFAIKGKGLDRLLASLAEKTPVLIAATMPTAGICKSYQESCEARAAIPSLKQIACDESADSAANQAQVRFFSVDASDYLKQAELEEEVFGPSTLVVCCHDSRCKESWRSSNRSIILKRERSEFSLPANAYITTAYW
jgi:alpha-ketoglutaric semialdehyde dehydrogenase